MFPGFLKVEPKDLSVNNLGPVVENSLNLGFNWSNLGVSPNRRLVPLFDGKSVLTSGSTASLMRKRQQERRLRAGMQCEIDDFTDEDLRARYCFR